MDDQCDVCQVELLQKGKQVCRMVGIGVVDVRLVAVAHADQVWRDGTVAVGRRDDVSPKVG